MARRFVVAAEVALTHARCRPSRVVHRPGLVEQLLAAAAGGQGDSAQAYFLVPARRPPCGAHLESVPAGDDRAGAGRGRVDLWLATHLEAGSGHCGRRFTRRSSRWSRAARCR